MRCPFLSDEGTVPSEDVVIFFFFFGFSFTSLSSFFTHIETNQSVGGAKTEYPGKNHLTHPQAEHGLSHI